MFYNVTYALKEARSGSGNTMKEKKLFSYIQNEKARKGTWCSKIRAKRLARYTAVGQGAGLIKSK